MAKHNLHRETFVNKIFKREAKLGKLEPWMIAPLLGFFLLGLGVTLLFKASYLTWVLFTSLPFFAWVWCVGTDPQRFFSAMNNVPKWGRGKPKHRQMLSKTRAANNRRMR